jgi:hypothetical protein
LDLRGLIRCDGDWESRRGIESTSELHLLQEVGVNPRNTGTCADEHLILGHTENGTGGEEITFGSGVYCIALLVLLLIAVGRRLGLRCGRRVGSLRMRTLVQVLECILREALTILVAWAVVPVVAQFALWTRTELLGRPRSEILVRGCAGR